MDLLDEITFGGLLKKYERTFGAEPPIESGTIQEALTFMQSELDKHASQTHPNYSNENQDIRNWLTAGAAH